MYRLMITVTREEAATSQVVGFDTREEADAVAKRLDKQGDKFVRHSIIVCKLYSEA